MFILGNHVFITKTVLNEHVTRRKLREPYEITKHTKIISNESILVNIIVGEI